MLLSLKDVAGCIMPPDVQTRIPGIHGPVLSWKNFVDRIKVTP